MAIQLAGFTRVARQLPDVPVNLAELLAEANAFLLSLPASKVKTVVWFQANCPLDGPGEALTVVIQYET